jgi:hypothetical protein
MPEQVPSMQELFAALGNLCYYRVNDEWVPMILVEVTSHDDLGNYIEVYPFRGTPFADKWYEENKVPHNWFPNIIKDPQPIPMKITDLSHIRISQPLF